VTSLCWCWEVTREDGGVYAFTSHDADLVFNDSVFEAASGFSASAVQSELGLTIDNMDVTGAISSDKITEQDLLDGKWDNATVTLYRVNWQDPEERIVVLSGSLGETKRGRMAFSAEIRGLAHLLSMTKGRLYTFQCPYTLGDENCTVDLDLPQFTSPGEVTVVSHPRWWIKVDGLEDDVSGLFSRGEITWLSGLNDGKVSQVRWHHTDVSGTRLELMLPTTKDIQVGDTFTIVAGCDKMFATCKNLFNNAINFGGFPYMPSNDILLSYPVKNGKNDGGSLFGN
jgi:uncharacterized phage protein (TIGR02218 family)